MSEREECFSEGKWWWGTGELQRGLKWCEKNCRGDWGTEIDAASFTFILKEDYIDFRHAFPKRTLEYMVHYDFDGPCVPDTIPLHPHAR